MNGRTLSRAIQRSRPSDRGATSSTATRGESGAKRGGAAGRRAGRRKGGGGRASRRVAGRGPRQRARGVDAGRAGSSIVPQTTRRGPPPDARTPRRSRRAAPAMAAHARARLRTLPRLRGTRADRGVGRGARRRRAAAGTGARRRPKAAGRVRGAAAGRDGGRGRADGRAPDRSLAGLARPRSAARRDAPAGWSLTDLEDVWLGAPAARGRGVRGGLPDRAGRGRRRRRSHRGCERLLAPGPLPRERLKGGGRVRTTCGRSWSSLARSSRSGLRSGRGSHPHSARPAGGGRRGARPRGRPRPRELGGPLRDRRLRRWSRRLVTGPTSSTERRRRSSALD